MKYIQTFGSHIGNRSLVNVKSITSYKVSFDNNTMVHVVAYTKDGYFILTPGRYIGRTDVDGFKMLQKFPIELVKEIHSAPDGSVFRCYGDDEKEWDILTDIGGCYSKD